MKKLLEKYKDRFSEFNMWQKLRNFARQAGIKTTYMVLLLFYAYKRKETPKWAKNVVIGAIGYFISPIDLIPDLTPILGYTDDIGVLTFGLVTIATYVNKEVKSRAKLKLGDLYGTYEEEELTAIDDKLNFD